MNKLKTYLKRLKKIKARGKEYQIKFFDDLRDDEGVGIYGFCDRHKKVIGLNATAPDEELLDTFLHEYLHAIWYESGMYSEGIPDWVEHIYLVNIVHDILLNKKELIKSLQLG